MEILGLSDSTPKPTSRARELFWPDLNTMPNAQSACETAAMACFVIAGLTAIVAFFTSLGALVDVVLFVIIAFGLREMWRSAALAGFLLYLIEQAFALSQGRFPGILSILVTVILFNAVRASFAYQRMRKTAA